MNLATVSFDFGVGLGAGRVNLTERCPGCGGTKRIDEVCCSAEAVAMVERRERDARRRALGRQPANDELAWF
jgi:hypothetical protein